MVEGEWNGDFDPLADPDERKHILSVLDSFRSYRRFAHLYGTHARRQAFYSLPSSHWHLLSQPPFSVLDTLSAVDDLIDTNSALAESIFKVGFQGFIAPTLDSEWVASVVDPRHATNEYEVYSTIMDRMNVKATQIDIDKARSCVHQFYRDWSAEGAVERSACFSPILSALEAEFSKQPIELSSDPSNKADIKILVPGAGLGRLVFDICRAGFTVEGNEISYHELMASSLILNHVSKPQEFTIAPFALSSSNHLTRADQLRTFAIPDVHPATELETASEGLRVHAGERMSMSAGDFCVVYNSPEYREHFTAVATVFFIDTAPNVIRYIEAVRNCLQPSGIWVNLGPLLWHHASRPQPSNEESEGVRASGKSVDAGIGDPGSVELTDEEVVKLVEHFGFSIERHETGKIETGYISNAESMLQSTYRPSFWIARKR